ncbi:MAG TPA: hypothetical protein HPQ00_17725, partial [Magnetococcales bacterium]|nr:hypothetical protein [Magnetococcales bacterium]
MSKVLVGCQHCHAKFKIESKNVPELGHKSLCPNCGSSFTMWHPDDYYLERYPREYAVFILDQKRLGYVPKIRYELKRIQAMEQWLKQRGTSILLASDALLEDYCAEVRQRLGSEEAAETKITLNQFFEVLAREKIRPGHPCTDKKESGLAEQLERVEDHGETPAPLVDPGQKIPKKTGRKRLILMAVLIFIMAVGGGFLLYREKEKKEALSHELQNLHERHDKEVKALK